MRSLSTGLFGDAAVFPPGDAPMAADDLVRSNPLPATDRVPA